MKSERTIIVTSLLTILLASLAQYDSTRAQQTCSGLQNPVTDIGERIISTKKFRADAADKQQEIVHNGARYLRARIEVSSLGTCDNWWLTVRDADFHVIQTFNRTDFQAVPNRWTNRVPTVERKSGNSSTFVSKIIFTLDACKNGTGPEIAFPEYVMMSAKSKNPFYSSQTRGKEKFRPLYSLSDNDNASTNKPLGDNVGFLMASWDRQSWTCSGVFLNEKWFLTNWHCGGPGEFPAAGFWNPQIVKDTIIDVSFDDDGLSQEYVGKSLVAKDFDLDFAILEVSAIDAARRIRPIPINVTPSALDGALRIIHHPEADRKMITMAACSAENHDFPSWQNRVAGVDFTHKCDTEKGSSGAPVFNSNNELVGLHHRGFDVNPVTCKDVEPKVNKAVKMSKIFAYLQSCHPQVASGLVVVGTPATPATPETPVPCPANH